MVDRPARKREHFVNKSVSNKESIGDKIDFTSENTDESIGENVKFAKRTSSMSSKDHCDCENVSIH